MKEEKFDYIVIGAGFSGLSCALRLAMFDHKVAIFESHSIPGGLNSYYKRRVNDELIRIDTGLHALTNFSLKGEIGTKLLPQILKQFRFSYDQLDLCPQKKSKIIIKDNELIFTNDINFLISQISELYPKDLDGFIKFLDFVKSEDLKKYNQPFESGNAIISRFLKDEELIKLLSFPVISYGSCWENDIDSYLYLSLFKAIYLEGLARPKDGIKTLIDLFEKKINTLSNSKIFYRSQVDNILAFDDVVHVKSGSNLYEVQKVFSSIGYPGTKQLIGEPYDKSGLSNVSFVEVVFVYATEKTGDYDETIIFFNESDTSIFSEKNVLTSKKAGVICCVENFESETQLNKIIKVTYYGNYSSWESLSREEYNQEKNMTIEHAKNILNKYLPLEQRTPSFIDCFTPKTIKKYTRHLNGAVYGSTQKFKNGIFSNSNNLILIGADQGNVGITGCILSGASMANKHGLSLG